MLTSRPNQWRRGVAASMAAIATGGLLAAAPLTADAVAKDAVNGCGAYSVKPRQGATVPSSAQSSQIFKVTTSKGTFGIRCGNGTTYGAVHIEVKHEVPTWADALSCITKAINHTGGSYDSSTGKTTYRYTFNGGTVVVVRGGVGIITAYPTGGSVPAKWGYCSAS